MHIKHSFTPGNQTFILETGELDGDGDGDAEFYGADDSSGDAR